MTGGNISLAVGGITDRCGICGVEITDGSERGLVGLNAVLCMHCTRNLGHYTPFWARVNLDSDMGFDLCAFGSYPNTPYWESPAAPTFIDAPGLNNQSNDEVNAFYSGLSTDVREAVWYLAVDQDPVHLTEVECSGIDDGDIAEVYRVGREPDDSNSFVKALSYLPYPHVISGTTVFADFSNATRTASEIAELLASQSETQEQGELSEFKSGPTGSGCESTDGHRQATGSGNGMESESESKSSGSDERSGQAGLSAFT
jgi:hypothetical protein